MLFLALTITGTLAFSEQPGDGDLHVLSPLLLLYQDVNSTTLGITISQLTTPVLVHVVRVTPGLDCQA